MRIGPRTGLGEMGGCSGREPEAGNSEPKQSAAVMVNAQADAPTSRMRKWAAT